MDVHKSYDYVRVGLTVRLLRNILDADTKRLAVREIKALREALTATNFNVALASMNKSQQFLDMEGTLAALPSDDALIGETLAAQVRDRIASVESVVFAEAITKQVYVMPERRYQTQWLLTEPSKFMKAGDFAKLEQVAQKDIASAGRCILFGEATAAAFHILRATEAVLKSYYFLHRKMNRLATPMWGNMLDQLRAKKKNTPPKTLLDSLDLIRSSYRNPTQHPQALYTMDGAQDLFGVCLDVIGKMAAELPVTVGTV